MLRARIEPLVRLGGLLVLAAAVAPPSLSAQAQGSWLERLGIDKLRFTALGAQVGRVNPQGIIPTTSYSVQVDYGEITTGWRIGFNATYWGSRFRDRSVRAYADSLRATIDLCRASESDSARFNQAYESPETTHFFHDALRLHFAFEILEGPIDGLAFTDNDFRHVV